MYIISLWHPNTGVELHVVSTTPGQVCAWRRLEPTPRASRLNTRKKPPSLYSLLYRLSATTRGNTETDKTKEKRNASRETTIEKTTRKQKKQQRGLMDIVHGTLEQALEQALVGPRLVGRALLMFDQ